MSDDKALEVKEAGEIVGKDAEMLKKFIEDGLPGIGSVEEKQRKEMEKRYKYGESFDEISRRMRIKKPIVIFYAHQMNWPKTRQEFHKEITENGDSREKLTAALIKDGLMKQVSEMHQSLDGQTTLKEKEHFLKLAKTFKDIMAKPVEKKGAIVNVNVGTGANISKISDDTIDLESNEEVDELEYYANLKREQEKK